MTGALLLLLVAPKWVLTFDQSFDGPKGGAPDPKIWSRDLGGGGFGNNELEFYTEGTDNVSLDGAGHLVIEARKEAKGGRDYTSARLKTKGRFEQRYGKIEARMRLPKGQGIWPAFWTLGADIDKVGWPACGEIDILEHIGRMPTKVYGTLHGPGYSGGEGIQGSTDSDTLYTAFHDYAVEWSPQKIVWTFDGKPYKTITARDVGTKAWPFEKPQFIILNLAVGGGWPGNPDTTTVFPQRLVVDHVRVWKDANLKVDEAALAKEDEERRTVKRGAPAKVPGVVRLADYAEAHDSDATNEGGAYRKDGVDLGEAGPPEAPYSIGWTKAGEWLDYDLDVTEGGRFKVEILAASEGAGGTVELAGTNAATIPDTGGWTNWKPVSLGEMNLTPGRRRVRLLMKTANAGGSVGNVALLRFTRA